jgi:cellulose biosynthesis protein BcsQ
VNTDFKKRVVFVDIDGPMVSDRTIRFDPKNKSNHPTVQDFIAKHCDEGDFAARVITYIHFDTVAVGMMNELYDQYPYEMVLSSSWFHIINEKQTRALFEYNGIKAPWHKRWNTPRRFNSTRGEEISWWLKENSSYDYIVLDDPSSFPDSSDPNVLRQFDIDPDYCIIVDPFIGLEYHHFDQMKNIFAGESIAARHGKMVAKVVNEQIYQKTLTDQ